MNRIQHRKVQDTNQEKTKPSHTAESPRQEKKEKKQKSIVEDEEE
jgi:hypothetical protein